MKKLVNIVSVILFVSLLLQISAYAIAPTDKTYDGTVIGQEVLSMRNEYEKHFVRADGSMFAVSYHEPIHKKNSNGEWIEIDNSLYDVKGRLQNFDSDFSVSFARSSNDNNLVSVKSENFELSWTITNTSKKAFSRATVNAQVVEKNESQLSEYEKLVVARKLQSEVLYESLLDSNIDAQYMVLPNKIKENIIINSKTDFSGYNMSVKALGLTATLKEDNSIIFTSSDDKTAFTLNTPYMYDSSDNISYKISITLNKTELGYNISYVPDSAWLTSEKRTYPIVIDPILTTTRTSDNTMDTYIYTGCTASSTRAAEEKLFVGIKDVSSVGTIHRVYWKAKTLPSLPLTATITGANFYTRCWSGTSSSGDFSLFRTNSTWSPNTITWANRPLGTGLLYNVSRDTDTNFVRFSGANVTNTVKDWYNSSSGHPNYGFIVTYTNESTSNTNYNSFYSSNNTVEPNSMPYLLISYTLSTPQADDYSNLGWSYVFSNSSQYRRISSGYMTTNRPTHKGIDIVGISSSILNVPILSPCSGIVIYKTYSSSDVGNYIVIQSNNMVSGSICIRVGFAHMSNASQLNVGDMVVPGTVIGYVGSTGDSTGPHLHLSMWESTSYYAAMSTAIKPERFFPQISFVYV